jgi:hypothetical protein
MYWTADKRELMARAAEKRQMANATLEDEVATELAKLEEEVAQKLALILTAPSRHRFARSDYKTVAIGNLSAESLELTCSI